MTLDLCCHPHSPTGLTTEGDWKSKGGGVQPASVLKGTKADAKAFNQVEGEAIMCVREAMLALSPASLSLSVMYVFQHASLKTGNGLETG